MLATLSISRLALLCLLMLTCASPVQQVLADQCQQECGLTCSSIQTCSTGPGYCECNTNGGAVAGIVIGIIVAIILSCIGCCYCCSCCCFRGRNINNHNNVINNQIQSPSPVMSPHYYSNVPQLQQPPIMNYPTNSFPGSHYPPTMAYPVGQYPSNSIPMVHPVVQPISPSGVAVAIPADTANGARV